MEDPFIAITPKYSLRLVVPVRFSLIGQIELWITYLGLLLLIIWNHTAICKFFVLGKNTW